MEKEIIIKKLDEENKKLIKQLEEAASPLIMEVMIYSLNRIKAIDFVLGLLKIDNVDLDNERDKLITHFKATPLQGLPIDMIQVTHRLQTLFYVQTLFNMGDENDTDS